MADGVIGALSTVGIVFLIVYRQKHHPRSEGRNSRFFGSNFWQAYFVEALALLEGAAILFVRAAEWRLDEEAGRLALPVLVVARRRALPELVASLENLIYLIAMFKIALAMVWLIVIARNITMGIAWHRFTAWFNIFFKRESDGSTALGAMKPLTSEGKAITLDDIDDLDEDSVLGVGKVEDFSWKGILDFTTCTECGRCQSQCPAWNTEKPLSPKLLITACATTPTPRRPATRPTPSARCIGAGTKGESGGTAGTDVLDYFYNPEDAPFVIDEDVLWNCTSCGACVQQCPVDIEHVDHIMDMRRYQVLVESNFPAELNQLFKGLENKGNPWNMSSTARMDWAKGLPFDVPVVGEDLESLDDGRLAVLGRLRRGLRGPRQEDHPCGRRAARHGRHLLRRPRQRRDLHRRPGPPRRQRVRLPGPGRCRTSRRSRSSRSRRSSRPAPTASTPSRTSTRTSASSSRSCTTPSCSTGSCARAS